VEHLERTGVDDEELRDKFTEYHPLYPAMDILGHIPNKDR
jgi:hypothetical protein